MPKNKFSNCVLNAKTIKLITKARINANNGEMYSEEEASKILALLNQRIAHQ